MSDRPWYRRGLRRAAYKLFPKTEFLGVHLMPLHFYGATAERGWMVSNTAVWKRPFALDRDLGGPADLEFVDQVVTDHLHEVPLASLLDGARLPNGEFGYGQVEGQLLHCVIRHFRPRRITEIGSGSSTMIMSAAAAANTAEGHPPARIRSIDPYALPEIAALPHVTVERRPAELPTTDPASGLQRGDLLFVDSTHTVKTGSEVPRLCLEVIPALPPGVLVHFHDIFLPYLHMPDVLTSPYDWQESTLVAGLITGNAHLEVLACLSALHHRDPDGLRARFPDYRPVSMTGGLFDRPLGPDAMFPSSLWLRTA